MAAYAWHAGGACRGRPPGRRGRGLDGVPGEGARRRHEQPLVDPQVAHFIHVPLRTRVKLPHSPQASPS